MSKTKGILTIVFHGEGAPEDCEFQGISVCAPRRLTEKDCTEEEVRKGDDLDDTSNVGSWDGSEVEVTKEGWVYSLSGDSYSDDGGFRILATFEKVTKELLKQVRKGNFKETIAYKDGKPSGTEVRYALGTAFEHLSTEEDEESEDELEEAEA